MKREDFGVETRDTAIGLAQMKKAAMLDRDRNEGFSNLAVLGVLWIGVRAIAWVIVVGVAAHFVWKYW